MVAFDTVSSNSNLELMRYIETLLAEQGIGAELLLDATGKKANLFATVGPPRSYGVILSGHTDVVPVAGQHWISDPFRLTLREGRLYGRGAADMKAFVACSLAALEFAELGALERPVHLAFSYDEEVGCLGAPELIKRLRTKIDHPAVAIVGEPSSMRIMGSHKSVHIYKVTVTGVPAHSSAAHLGVSANAIAIRLMNHLLDIADRLRAEELCDPEFIPPFSTLTVGVMGGGTAANILASEATFTFDLRTLPQLDPAVILESFQVEAKAARAAFPDATISLEQLAVVPPLARVLDGEAERFVRVIGGDNLKMIAGSFGAEAGQFQQAGFPTVICGPGSIDQAHQANEFIDLGEIERCMRFMEKLFAAMSRASAEA